MKRKLFLILLLLLFTLSSISIYIDENPNKTYAASNWAKDVQLLARCVNGEARGESYEGQVAVAAVILNRVEHPSFPNTIAGVIYQPGAFTATVDGQIDVPISENSTVYKACSDAMNGWDPSGGAIYYYNPAKTTNKWIYSRTVVRVIGNHTFAI
ncbi:MAG: cell wall hydrolase [Clostridia bacterium]|nr:cell wall hydrolase [Clostridia bacterium]